MIPHSGNTRALGIGDTITAEDFVIIPATDHDELPEFMPVDEPEVGRILDGSEYHEYRRYTQVDPITQICNEHGIITPMGKAALLQAIENVALLDRKQRDYSSSNISEFGGYGVMVRLYDKISRLKNLIRNVAQPNNESISDTWLDISNYGLIGQLLDKKIWK